MKVKNYICDIDGKLSSCKQNRAKMSYWEVFYHSQITWGGIRARFVNIKESFIDMIRSIVDFAVCILDIPLWVVLSPYVIYKKWIDAKEWVKNNE